MLSVTTNINASLFLDKDDITGQPLLSFDRSPIVQLAVAGNRYNRSMNRLLIAEHGVNLMVWRLIALLACHPQSTVVWAAEKTGIDKSAVSRTLNELHAGGLICSNANKSDPRRKSWRLSRQGQNLYTRMLATSVRVHEALLAEFSEQDIVQLSLLLGNMLSNFENLPVEVTSP